MTTEEQIRKRAEEEIATLRERERQAKEKARQEAHSAIVFSLSVILGKDGITLKQSERSDYSFKAFKTAEPETTYDFSIHTGKSYSWENIKTLIDLQSVGYYGKRKANRRKFENVKTEQLPKVAEQIAKRIALEKERADEDKASMARAEREGRESRENMELGFKELGFRGQSQFVDGHWQQANGPFEWTRRSDGTYRLELDRKSFTLEQARAIAEMLKQNGI